MKIHNNYLAIDTIPVRVQRLADLTGNCEPAIAELGLDAEMADWMRNASDIFIRKIAEAQVLKGDKSLAFEKFHNKMKALLEIYTPVKSLLKALIKGTEQANIIIEAYAIQGTLPNTYNLLTVKTEILIERHNLLKAEGDPRVVPQKFIDDLTLKLEEMRLAHDKTNAAKIISVRAYEELHELMQEDTKKLRIFYHIAAAVWGKKSPNFLAVGFVPAKERPKHRKKKEEDS
jgi:hypothetical protein